MRGLPIKSFSCIEKCPSCLKCKQHKLLIGLKTINTIDSILQLLHMDLFGPIHLLAIGRKAHCLVINDFFSYFSWNFLLEHKDETAQFIIKFITLVERQTDKKVKCILSDNETEFCNKTVDDFCHSLGIDHQISALYTPQQNEVVECRNQTLIEAARTMLSDSKLPFFFWGKQLILLSSFRTVC